MACYVYVLCVYSAQLLAMAHWEQSVMAVFTKRNYFVSILLLVSDPKQLLRDLFGKCRFRTIAS